ncbi:MAG: hypothetical protein HYT87_07665 [Nitrospirae bacterium]|nr:hypothetical protein [Nitrospirota bacterium]
MGISEVNEFAEPGVEIRKRLITQALTKSQDVKKTDEPIPENCHFHPDGLPTVF